MLGALVIVFREVIEAGLIVGIVLAVTQGVPGRGRWIAGGVAGGIVAASLLAVFADGLARAISGIGQELFNAGVLALAVCMLAWHNIWMARHGREMASQMKAMGRSVTEGSTTLAALAIVVGVAVLREGSEVVLFLYGLALSGGSTMWDLLLGSVVGLALGCGVGALTFFGLVTIPTGHLFSVTTLLITFVAAGLAAQSIFFLQQAGLLTTLSQTAWDTSSILSDRSLFGRLLHTMFGYIDQPSELQVVVYAATLATIFALSRIFKPSRSAEKPVMQLS
jgi:high-affinity iron transporter